MSQITGAQSLVKSLEAAGVDVMFGLPGGAILLTIRSTIQEFDISWFDMNKVQVMLQRDMHK